jgi:hypothetical protein
MSLLVKALIPFVVFLVFALARKYMPVAAVKSSEQDYSLAELDTRFSGTQWVVGVSMVTIGFLFLICTHAAFVALNHAIAAADGPARFYLWPQSAIWWFFPGFGALALSWEITLQLWSVLGKREDASLYAQWTSLKAGFDSTRILRWMAVLIALPIGILTVLELSVHTALRQEEIRDCGYAFASCNIYRYADARRKTIINGFRNRDSKLIRRAGIVIDFKDGRRWSSASIGDFSARIDPALEGILEDRIHLPYNYAQTEEDIPPVSDPSAAAN